MIAVLVLVGFVGGFRKGLVSALLSLGGLLLALYGGWRYAPDVSLWVERRWGWQSALTEYLQGLEALPESLSRLMVSFEGELTHVLFTVLAFALIFSIIRTLSEGLGRAIHGVLSLAFLGGLDHLLGGIFAGLATLVALAVFLGVTLTVTTFVPVLGALPAVIEESPIALELVRFFFRVGPLGEFIYPLINRGHFATRL